ncbi:MAG: hypothetical protein O7B79_11385 [SAR324 cluster bacterium]|nr:hypothetical protein [SAR324 cluster bacterium]
MITALPSAARPAAPLPWAVWLGVLCGVVAAGGACGRQTPPRPVSEVLPRPEGLVAWQREGRVLVAWPMPSAQTAQRLGGVEGFVLLIERLPRDCPSCTPQEEREVDLPAGKGASPPLRVEEGRAYYQFPLPAGTALWRLRVVTEYGAGGTMPSRAVSLETPAEVPAQALAWENVSGGKEAPPSLRLFWRPRREGIFRVITKQGAQLEQARYFRANLYRRRPGQPWPSRPLNVQPLETGQQILPLPREGALEFTLRLVDRFGNEGAASPPVLIAPASGKQ